MIEATRITIQSDEKSNHIMPMNAADQIHVVIDRNFQMFSNQIHVKTIKTIEANSNDNG